MRITSLQGNTQRLDGGAMFGNAPRALWQRWCPPDELGRISLACRCFLVEDQGRRLLVETGVGAFFPPKLRQRYGVVEEEHCLLEALARRGIEPEDIDVIFLSHLHFDHAGGLLKSYAEGRALELAFPNAQYVVGENALSRARAPHSRDRASFIQELLPLLEDSGRLVTLPSGSRSHPLLGERVQLTESNGHTPGMLLPTFLGREHSATFCADLVPGQPWVHLPMTMGYDRYPELLIDEKRELYETLGEGAWLLFTHDAQMAAGRLTLSEQGKFQVEEPLSELTDWKLDSALR